MGYNLRSHSSQWPKEPIGLITLVVIVAGLAVYWFVLRPGSNPLPASIKNQIGYKAVVASSKTGNLSQPGYQYQGGQKTLTFNVTTDNTNVIFVEQPAPSSLGSGDQIYYQALGLHPYAQFQSNLGPVALVNFYQSGNLKQAGQTAILVSQGTMVVANPQKNLTNDQWKNLINSLKITK